MKQGTTEAVVRVRNSAHTANFDDDYAPVFQRITSGNGASADDRLDDAVKRIVYETIGDIPEGSKSEKTKEKKSGKAKSNKPQKKKPNGLFIFGLILLIVLAVLATAYCVIAFRYRDKFIEGTKINNEDVSQMTVAQVESLIKQQVETYSLVLTFRGGATETLSNDDVGYTYVSSNEVSSIMTSQNKFRWFEGKYLKRTEEYTVDKAASYDKEKALAALTALPEFQPENETAPENAYLTPESDSSFTIVPEIQGNTLKSDVVESAFYDAVGSASGTLDVSSLAGAYEAPTVTADTADLVAQKDILNNFLSTSVTYQLPQGNQTLDYNVLKDWITKQDNGFYYVDQDNLNAQVTAYVKSMAAATDTLKKTRTFKSTKRGNVELACAEYGWIIDQPSEVTQTISDISNHLQTTREPEWSRHDAQKDPQFGGTYIEVDIKNQHVYYYENNTLVLDSACVTGLSTDNTRATPTGIFSILDKEQDRMLRGPLQEDGTYQWESHVDYWMHFYAGCGFHDASWRTDFGGNIYTYDGSHGCVNLPSSFAPQLYAKLQKGTPVIVF